MEFDKKNHAHIHNAVEQEECHAAKKWKEEATNARKRKMCKLAKTDRSQVHKAVKFAETDIGPALQGSKKTKYSI